MPLLAVAAMAAHMFVLSAFETPMTQPTPLPLIAAHRGASSEMPENTLAAFRRAIEQGADAIETDLWLTGDGKIILIHDGNTKRTCGEPGLKVSESKFDDLRALDAGKWKNVPGEKLPSLKELLDLAPANMKLFLEIKCGPEIVPEFVREIRASTLKPEQIVMITFHDEVIPALKAAMPELQAYLLYEFKRDEQGGYTQTADELIERAKKLGADGLDLGMYPKSIDAVTPELIAKAKAAGLSFHAWTIDDVNIARRAIELGAASITTNRPGKLRAELQQMATTRPFAK